MTTYNICNDDNEILGTFDLKKQGKYWFLTARTPTGHGFVGTYKTKREALNSLEEICANGLTFFKFMVAGVA